MNERNKRRLGILAVGLVWFLNGTVSTTIAPRYADLAASLGLGTAEIGLARTGETFGLAVVGSLLALGLARHLGSRRSYSGPLILFCLYPAVIPLVNSAWELFGAQFFRGATNAPVDQVQIALGLSISLQAGKVLLPRFQAAYSVGAVASTTSSALTADRIDLSTFLFGTAIVTVTLGFVALWFLPPIVPQAKQEVMEATYHGSIKVLGLLCFFSLLAQYLGGDWTALFYSTVLHTKPAYCGYGALFFQLGVIIVLTLGTYLDKRFGSFRVVRFGAALYAAAMTALVLSHSVVLATAALFVAGIGAGNLVPLALSVLRGHPRYQIQVARVTAVMYLAPGVSKLTGLIAAGSSLRWTLAAAIPVGAAIAFMASVLRPGGGVK